MNLKTCLHSSTLDTMPELKERCYFFHIRLLDPAPQQCRFVIFLKQKPEHKQSKELYRECNCNNSITSHEEIVNDTEPLCN